MKIRFLKVNTVSENNQTGVYYVIKKHTFLNLSEINRIDVLNMTMNHEYEYTSYDGKKNKYNYDAQVYQAKFKDGTEVDFITNQDFQYE